MGMIASQISVSSLTIVYSLVYPLCGVFTGDLWIPGTKGN